MLEEPPAVVVKIPEVDLRDPAVVRIDRLSKWGNPYVVGIDGDRATVIKAYRRWILDRPDLLEALGELEGKRLACWCAPRACHGDVLVELLENRAGLPLGRKAPGRPCPRCNSRYGMVTGQDLCRNCTRDALRRGETVEVVPLEAAEPLDPEAEGWACMLTACESCGRPSIFQTCHPCRAG
ncbi:MAG: DUF4326 domain-containing protein [Candidatus Nanopelagicales bacterium]